MRLRSRSGAAARSRQSDARLSIAQSAMEVDEIEELPIPAQTDTIQLVRLGHSVQLLSDLSQLILSNDPVQEIWKDLTFICKGGETVRWNLLLASRWSSVVREVMSDGRIKAGNDKAVIFCPDIDVLEIDNVLKLSISGQVDLEDERKARSVGETLTSLGAAVDFSSETVCTTTTKESQEWKPLNNVDEAVPSDNESDIQQYEGYAYDSDCDMKPDSQDNEFMPLSNDNNCTDQLSEEEEEEEQNDEEEEKADLDPITGKLLVYLKCPMCPKSRRDINGLKKHMIDHHFRYDIMRLAGVEMDDVGTMCHLCGKTWERLHRQKSRRQNIFYKHLAFSHRYLDKVMPEEMRSKLNEDILKARPQIQKWFLFQTEPEVRPQQSCPLCSKTFSVIDSLKKHLVRTHLKSNIFEISGVTDFHRCQLCLKTLDNSTDHEMQKQRMLTHLAGIHGYFEQAMDQELKQKWNELKKILPSKERVDPRTRRISPEELANRVKKATLTSIVSLKCPLCPNTFNRHRDFVPHFTVVHYRKEILKYAKTPEKAIDDAKCHLCGKQYKKDVKKRCMKVFTLVRHLGMNHKILEIVVPEQVKKQFNDAVLEAMPTIRKTHLFVTNDTVIKGQKCLRCDKTFEMKRRYQDHMIAVHFVPDILAVSNNTDVSFCNICDKPVADLKKIYLQRFNMARHLALKHSFLAKVLEKEGLTERYVEVMDQFKNTKAKKD